MTQSSTPDANRFCHSGRVILGEWSAIGAMRNFWSILFLFWLLFLAGCAAKKKAVAPPQPPPPAPVRSQMPPPSAEVIEHCVISKQENANTVTCRCEPVTTRIDSKTGRTVIVCKKVPEKR